MNFQDVVQGDLQQFTAEPKKQIVHTRGSHGMLNASKLWKENRQDKNLCVTRQLGDEKNASLGRRGSQPHCTVGNQQMSPNVKSRSSSGSMPFRYAVIKQMRWKNLKRVAVRSRKSEDYWEWKNFPFLWQESTHLDSLNSCMYNL